MCQTGWLECGWRLILARVIPIRRVLLGLHIFWNSIAQRTAVSRYCCNFIITWPWTWSGIQIFGECAGNRIESSGSPTTIWFNDFPPPYNLNNAKRIGIERNGSAATILFDDFQLPLSNINTNKQCVFILRLHLRHEVDSITTVNTQGREPCSLQVSQCPFHVSIIP